MPIIRENKALHRVYHYKDNYNETDLGGVITVNADTRLVTHDAYYQNYVRKDVTKRDWRRLIAEGKNATTYLHGVKYSCEHTWGQAYLHNQLNLREGGDNPLLTPKGPSISLALLTATSSTSMGCPL